LLGLKVSFRSFRRRWNAGKLESGELQNKKRQHFC